MAVFAALRGVLAPYAKTMKAVEKPGKYELYSATMKDRVGRPLFISAVHVKKSYVSFHLMPIYFDPGLVKTLTPALRKRMQGKACFNFTAPDAVPLEELKALTKVGLERFKTVKLPW